MSEFLVHMRDTDAVSDSPPRQLKCLDRKFGPGKIWPGHGLLKAYEFPTERLRQDSLETVGPRSLPLLPYWGAFSTSSL
jgi:hypothetical protein